MKHFKIVHKNVLVAQVFADECIQDSAFSVTFKTANKGSHSVWIEVPDCEVYLNVAENGLDWQRLEFKSFEQFYANRPDILAQVTIR